MAVRKEGRGKGEGSPGEVASGGLMTDCSLMMFLSGAIAYKWPFKASILQHYECFKLKHHRPLLMTVLVTLLLFFMISTCDSRTKKDEPASWSQWPSASSKKNNKVREVRMPHLKLQSQGIKATCYQHWD